MTNGAFADRLALGTAQFGLPYGLNNTAGQPALAGVADILREARDAGLTLLDTAAVYGDAEARIGQLQAITQDFAVVTKVANGPNVTHQVQASLDRLGRPAVAGVLFHSAFSFASRDAGWRALLAEHAQGRIGQTGLSVYRMAHLLNGDFATADAATQPGILQVPLSVLDQHFVPHVADLATTRGIEIHVRSAFLQGLLLRDPDQLPSFFQPLAPKLRQLRAVAATGGIPLSALLLLFAAQTPGVRRVVIGVDSVANLYENLRAAAYWDTALALRPQLEALAEPDNTFTLPYTWPKTT
ncbi:MAG: aldo/keto reductase [Hymenobacteraceae bacterium]|nr:aldo/keto reductase [Hymenobacteraceae bacterium]